MSNGGQDAQQMRITQGIQTRQFQLGGHRIMHSPAGEADQHPDGLDAHQAAVGVVGVIRQSVGASNVDPVQRLCHPRPRFIDRQHALFPAGWPRL